MLASGTSQPAPSYCKFAVKQLRKGYCLVASGRSSAAGSLPSRRQRITAAPSIAIHPARNTRISTSKTLKSTSEVAASLMLKYIETPQNQRSCKELVTENCFFVTAKATLSLKPTSE